MTRAIRYDGRRFRVIANVANGESSAETIFEYSQTGNTVWARYSGGAVRMGVLVGVVNDDQSLDLRYHHIHSSGEFRSGRCHSVPELLADGRLRLKESWQWTTGDQSRGESVIEELEQDPRP